MWARRERGGHQITVCVRCRNAVCSGARANLRLQRSARASGYLWKSWSVRNSLNVSTGFLCWASAGVHALLPSSYNFIKGTKQRQLTNMGWLVKRTLVQKSIIFFTLNGVEMFYQYNLKKSNLQCFSSTLQVILNSFKSSWPGHNVLPLKYVFSLIQLDLACTHTLREKLFCFLHPTLLGVEEGVSPVHRLPSAYWVFLDSPRHLEIDSHIPTCVCLCLRVCVCV